MWQRESSFLSAAFITVCFGRLTQSSADGVLIFEKSCDAYKRLVKDHNHACRFHWRVTNAPFACHHFCTIQIIRVALSGEAIKYT
jgi:hypothetical protein